MKAERQARAAPVGAGLDLLARGRARFSAGDLDAAGADIDRALGALEAAGDRPGQARALKARADLRISRRDQPGALRDAGEAVARGETTGDPALAAELWKASGDLRLASGDAAGAAGAYDRALAALEAASDRARRPRVLVARGRARARQGETRAAHADLDAAIELSRELPDRAGLRRALRARGDLWLEHGDAGSAEIDHRRAGRPEADGHADMGALLARFPAAQREAAGSRAPPVVEAVDELLARAWAHLARGRILTGKDDRRRVAHFTSAIGLLQLLGDSPGLGAAHLARAAALLEQGQTVAATAQCDRALGVLGRIEERRSHAAGAALVRSPRKARQEEPLPELETNGEAIRDLLHAVGAPVDRESALADLGGLFCLPRRPQAPPPRVPDRPQVARRPPRVRVIVCEELSRVPVLQPGDAPLLWVNDWWDGPIEAVVDLRGERCMLLLHDQPIQGAHTFMWRWMVYRLTPEQRADEERWHELFVRHVGDHWCAERHRRDHAPPRGPRDPDQFYRAHQGRPPLDLTRNELLGWMEEPPT